MSTSVRKSSRVAAQETVKRVEADLLAHIKSLQTLSEIAGLKAQMESGMFPKTKAVKKALDEQKQKIVKEQEDDTTSPGEVNQKRKRLTRQARKLAAKPKRSNLFFGPGTRKKSRARITMEREGAARQAAENAELNAALEAEAERIEAENAAAAAVPRNAVMNNLAERFGRASLGPANRGAHTTYSRKGVPGYHFNAMGGSRRRRRAGKGRSRRSRR
jgi:hypothetical protein